MKGPRYYEEKASRLRDMGFPAAAEEMEVMARQMRRQQDRNRRSMPYGRRDLAERNRAAERAFADGDQFAMECAVADVEEMQMANGGGR